MRRLIIYAFLVIVLGALLFSGYRFIVGFSYTRHITLPPQLLASSSDMASSTAASTTEPLQSSVFGNASLASESEASSTVDSSLWQSYTDPQSGFSLRYPPDFVANTDTPGTLTLFIPKSHYFNWPLLDDAKVTVVASSSCPAILPNIRGGAHPASLAVGSYIFDYSEGSDVGAGNIYREQAYDLKDGALCYHIDLFDHGANGAGLYVSDQSLISQYDSQHGDDLSALVDIFNEIVRSFRIISP